MAGDLERRDRHDRALLRTLGVRSSGGGSAGVSATANRTASEVDLGVVGPDLPPAGPELVERHVRQDEERVLGEVEDVGDAALARVQACPRMTKESVYSVSRTCGGPGACETVEHEQTIRSPAARGEVSPTRRRRPGARGHQVLGAVLEPSYSAVTVSTVSISSAVLSGRRRTIRGKRSAEARLVAVRADDDVERDLDDDRRLDLAVAAVTGDRVRLEPAGHLGDLGVGQAAVRLADR